MKLMSVILLFAGLNISAFAVSPTEGLPADVVQKHLAITGDTCVTDAPFGPESFELAPDVNLYLILCDSAAYQTSSRGYVKTAAGIEQVIVLAYDHDTRSVRANLDLGDAAYNPATKSLTTNSKGRGLADCGQSTASRVSVNNSTVRVYTTQIRSKTKCDGNTNWPVVFRQR